MVSKEKGAGRSIGESIGGSFWVGFILVAMDMLRKTLIASLFVIR
jgi:hypothetical protein